MNEKSYMLFNFNTVKADSRFINLIRTISNQIAIDYHLENTQPGFPSIQGYRVITEEKIGKTLFVEYAMDIFGIEAEYWNLGTVGHGFKFKKTEALTQYILANPGTIDS